jgi:DNA-binding SARP family transcriptional activator
MIRVRTLGTIDVRAADGAEIRVLIAQAKRLALLAYLILARPRGPQRRDTLTALFWPEHDAEHARNSLSQAVHFLRRALGDDVFERARGDELCLRADVIWCDALQFERAITEHRDAEALELYGGPFVAGLHVVDGAPELEQWIDEERARLARCWADAVERAAIAADPRNALPHHWYAIILATLDRRDDAVREIRRARALDSLSGPLNRALSQIEMWAGVRDPTFAAPERRPIIDPAFKNDYADHARYDALVGQCARAAAEIRTAYELSPADAMVAAATCTCTCAAATATARAGCWRR